MSADAAKALRAHVNVLRKEAIALRDLAEREFRRGGRDGSAACIEAYADALDWAIEMARDAAKKAQAR